MISAAQAESAIPASARVSDPDILGIALSHAPKHGTWAEFGVATGRTLARLAAARGAAEVWGFDSFRGLPEDWIAGHPKGTFARETIPHPPPGVRLAVGLFEETLPAWHPRSAVTFVHIDCDLYSSTKTVLGWVGPLLAPGAIISFDEILRYAGYEGHELRALVESEIRFEWLAVYGDRGAIRVL